LHAQRVRYYDPASEDPPATANDLEISSAFPKIDTTRAPLTS
jgi:hypothetical protein